jgi:MurNAc alpha-1-phosphate uridylyltransferase
MRALIFAAGRGERMRPLSDLTPKPLLSAGGKRLIEWHLEALARAGIRQIVINTAHGAEQFPETLGDGARYGVAIRYSHEGPEPLETGGGMLYALSLLGEGPFIALNGDVWSDYEFARLPDDPDGLAHLVLIDNPAHHPHGDFLLGRDGRVRAPHVPAPPGPAPRLEAYDPHDERVTRTFAGIGVYRPELLEPWREVVEKDAEPGTQPRFKLAPLLLRAMAAHAVTGERHRGAWMDIGTPERLAELRRRLD